MFGVLQVSSEDISLLRSDSRVMTSVLPSPGCLVSFYVPFEEVVHPAARKMPPI
jgi:hypothetical protein